MGSLAMTGLSGLSGIIQNEYVSRLLDTGPFAGWIMGEPFGSGDRSIDQINSPAQDGTYQGVTLGEDGIGDGNTCIQLDGVLDYNNINSPTARAVFNGDEGSALIWGRTSAWEDGAERRLLVVSGPGAFVILRKNVALNSFSYLYDDAVSTKARTITLSTTDWFSALLTWSATANETIAYLNSVQQGAILACAGWGAIVPNTMLIGAGTTAPALVWDGLAAHCWLWNRPLTPVEAQSVGVR
jgi:hypothetical protein